MSFWKKFFGGGSKPTPVASVKPQPSSPPPKAAPIPPSQAPSVPEQDTNAMDKDGQTELMLTADDRNLKNVALLIAAFRGDTMVVQEMLAKGADVNAEMRDGGTALIIACQQGHKQIVQMLLANGAHLKAKMNDGKTAFTLASEKGHNEINELIIHAAVSQAVGDLQHYSNEPVSQEQIGALAAFQDLIKGLDNPHEKLAMVSADALGKLGDPVAIQPLMRILSKGDNTGVIAGSALISIGSAAVDPLIALLRGPANNLSAKGLALFALGKSGERRAIEAIRTAAKDDDSTLRSIAARTLKDVGMSG